MKELKRNKINLSKVVIKLNGKLRNDELVALRSSVGWDNLLHPFSKIRKKLFAHFTARINDELVGFVDVLSDSYADAFIQNLVVHPKWQGSGIGSRLVKETIIFLQKKNIKCIQLTFDESLVTFYKKFGFHISRSGIIDKDYMNVKLS